MLLITWWKYNWLRTPARWRQSWTSTSHSSGGQSLKFYPIIFCYCYSNRCYYYSYYYHYQGKQFTSTFSSPPPAKWQTSGDLRSGGVAGCDGLRLCRFQVRIQILPGTRCQVPIFCRWYIARLREACIVVWLYLGQWLDRWGFSAMLWWWRRRRHYSLQRF